MARLAKKKKAATEELPSSTSKSQIAQVITELEDFQRGYGDEWLRIIKSDATQAAMLVTNVRKLKFIGMLTNEQIAEHGAIILADLRGHLQLEEDLLTLSTKKEFSLPFEEADVYLSPEEAVEHEEVRKKYREQLRRQQYNA